MFEKVKIAVSSGLVYLAGMVSDEAFDEVIRELTHEKAEAMAIKYIRQYFAGEGYSLCNYSNCLIFKPLLKLEGKYYCEPHEFKKKTENMLQKNGSHATIGE